MISRRVTLLVAAYACIALAVLTFRPMQTPGPFLRDFEAYWSAGSAWNAHANPYGRAVWNAERAVPGVRTDRDELLPFVGPPQTLLMWSAFARVDYVTAARAWFAALVAATIALLAACAAGAGFRPNAAAIAALVALTLAFGPLSSDLALGQVALVAFVGAALTALPRLRSYAPAAVAGAMVAFAQPNVGVGIASQLPRARVAFAIAIAIAATYLAGAIAAGWRWPIEYSGVLAAHAQSERGSAIQFSAAAIAHGFGASNDAAIAIAAALAIVAICAAVAVFRRVSDSFARFAAISPLAPFVATFFHEHDLVVAYAAVTWCAVRTRGRLRAAALIGTLLVATDWLGMAQRPTGIVQSALLAIAVAVAFIACCRPKRSAEGAESKDAFVVACAAMAIVFGVAAWLATTHPVPVWPDTLGHFHAASGAPATVVWAQEQQRSGLLAPSAAWAMLRSLSLLGCAVLWWVVCRTCVRDGRGEKLIDGSLVSDRGGNGRRVLDFFVAAVGRTRGRNDESARAGNPPRISPRCRRSSCCRMASMPQD